MDKRGAIQGKKMQGTAENRLENAGKRKYMWITEAEGKKGRNAAAVLPGSSPGYPPDKKINFVTFHNA